MTSPKLIATESADTMKRRIRAHHSNTAGNGPEWVVVTEVRNAAGFDAHRSADALAFNTWPSRGLAVHGFEIKVSRSDWQRELQDPAKAEAFAQFCDYWWVAAPEGVVLPGELPAGWGLMVPNRGARLRVATPATKREAKPIGRSFMAAILRRGAEQAPAAAELEELLQAARKSTREEMQRNREQLEKDLEAYKVILQSFNNGYREAGGKQYQPLSIHAGYGRQVSAADQAKALGATVAAHELLDPVALRDQAVRFAQAVQKAAAEVIAHADAVLAEAPL